MIDEVHFTHRVVLGLIRTAELFSAQFAGDEPTSHASGYGDAAGYRTHRVTNHHNQLGAGRDGIQRSHACPDGAKLEAVHLT